LSYNKFDRGIARFIGFREVDPKWVTRLPHMNGTYGPATGVIVTWTIFCCIWAGLAVAIGWHFVSEDWDGNGPLPDQAIIALVGVVLFVLMLWHMHRRIRTRYEIRDGTLTCLSAGGRNVWTESLDGLQLVTGEEAPTRGIPSIPYITLYWADHKRKLILHDSLKKALEMQSEGERELAKERVQAD